ncbi:conjugative transfer ATPase [Pasteurella atlantica]|uniref:Conjugative transfer ATPase n=2 Tax=Pasteurellaceae TaxID=712 RepID=A0ACC6HKX6_9PAST|nr:conjugative transfer ATPase [Pasteurella atlantica]MDP8051515.1 conjugative transfer ATPase [Pasteurella atlantica]MDP8104906.1 conjugative transfer ATPase [Pasteurella atlantica]MDP8148280.1 conjugative transfer ATPase [Pasteurella atlantica]
MSKTSIHPILNVFLRLTGEWSLVGAPPLTEKQYKELFTTYPAFVDYFPIISYLPDEEVYVFDDYLNVAKIYEINTRYMAAKSEQALDTFNSSIALALNALPTYDSNPYIVQIFATKQPISNIGDYLESKIDSTLLKDKLTQAIVNIIREQSEILTHSRGIFPDSRLQGDIGWRVGEQKVYLIIYQKRTPNEWKKSKKTPSQQITHDLTSFNAAIQSSGIKLTPLLPHDLINWLSPFFGNERKVTPQDIELNRELANTDIGQQIFSEQPRYHHDHKEDTEKGIWQFGSKWSRYITLGGIEKCPRSGAITLGEQQTDGSSMILSASFFEKLPVGSMFTYTLIPQTDSQMKFEMSLVANKAADTVSREAYYANEQANTAYEEMMRNHEKVFYTQLGIYLSADNLETLLNDTETTISEVRSLRLLQVVDPKWDLFPQHSYIKALPCVYDFKNDRNATLRARKTYTSHIASLLPFFGNKSGGVNPCYIMYSRTGEPFYLNPFHHNDKEKVSHEVFFGPSGSGKSATVCYMTLMSMAVNNPRTFLFDYGGSFKLLADFAEAHGKKVKRIKFTRNSKDVIAPFFETKKALLEAEQAKNINEGNFVGNDESEESEEENRTYLGEMEAILRVMITGGNDIENANMTQTELSELNQALVRGLEMSVERGEPHARPIHMADAMAEMADKQREKGMIDTAKSLYEKESALRRWTQGLHGILFNRTASGFDPNYDLTLVEIGNLAQTPDMMAVAGLSAIYNITAMAEELQYSGRSIEIKIDESHLWAKINMLMDGLTVGSKVFRKLETWLCLITQDISDYKGDATKILANAEFWHLMKMSNKEIKQATKILNLDEEVQHLIKFPKKENGRFVEGVTISEKYPDTLVRYVLPPLILALAQTEGKEKKHRKNIMEQLGCTELEAAYHIAKDMTEKYKQFQEM